MSMTTLIQKIKEYETKHPNEEHMKVSVIEECHILLNREDHYGHGYIIYQFPSSQDCIIFSDGEDMEGEYALHCFKISEEDLFQCWKVDDGFGSGFWSAIIKVGELIFGERHWAMPAEKEK